MTQYMLLIRNEDTDFSKFSAKDFQDLMKKYKDWTQKIVQDGTYVSGEKLTHDLGKSLKVKSGKIIVDGPYADTKDAIGGYYIIKAKSLDAAVEVGKGCPALSYGGSLEVRAVDKV